MNVITANFTMIKIPSHQLIQEKALDKDEKTLSAPAEIQGRCPGEQLHS